MSPSTRTAFFISGNGTTMEAVLLACQKKELDGISPVLVISSSKDAQGLEKARALNIPTALLDRKDFKTPEQFGDAILQVCNGFSVDLISCNGWLPHTPKNVIETFVGRIINQHPGPLDPGRGNDFGGKGMYGLRVICARIIYEWVVNANAPWTEATVHFVTEQIDGGDLIEVKKVDLPKPKRKITFAELKKNLELQKYLVDETVRFQKNFLPIEHQTVINSLKLFSFGKLPNGFHRTSSLIEMGTRDLLVESKQLAIQLFPIG